MQRNEVDKIDRVAYLRMPQTVLRFLGHTEISRYRFFQFPIIDINRPEWFGAPEKELLEVNRILLGALSLPISSIDAQGGDWEQGQDETVVDYSALHNGYLRSRLHKNKVPISVAPYSAIDFSPRLADLKLPFEDLARCFVRSRRLGRYANIKKFYDWTGPSKQSAGIYLRWFWRSEALNFDLARSRVKLARQNLESISPFFGEYMRASRALLVLPSAPPDTPDYGESIKKMLRGNSKLLEYIENYQPTIFVKPHPWLGEVSSADFEFLRSKVQFAKLNIDKAIPAEALLFSRDDSKVAAHIGSSIFSLDSTRIFALEEDNTRKLLKSYHLTGSRRMMNDTSFPWRTD